MSEMIINTPYGDQYVVNLETGEMYRPNQSPSGEWKFVGFYSTRSASTIIPLRDIREDPGLLDRVPWLYKNGSPRFTIRDTDHGTTRIHSNTTRHGVKYAYVRDEPPFYGDYVQLLDPRGQPCENHATVYRSEKKLTGGLFEVSDQNGEDWIVRRSPEMDTPYRRAWRQVING